MTCPEGNLTSPGGFFVLWNISEMRQLALTNEVFLV